MRYRHDHGRHQLRIGRFMAVRADEGSLPAAFFQLCTAAAAVILRIQPAHQLHAGDAREGQMLRTQRPAAALIHVGKAFQAGIRRAFFRPDEKCRVIDQKSKVQSFGSGLGYRRETELAVLFPDQHFPFVTVEKNEIIRPGRPSVRKTVVIYVRKNILDHKRLLDKSRKSIAQRRKNGKKKQPLRETVLMG